VFDYAHSAVASRTTFIPPSLLAGSTYYFAVAAEDGQALTSAYSEEVSCMAPSGGSPSGASDLDGRPPGDGATLTPEFGEAPLKITYDASALIGAEDGEMRVTWDFGNGDASDQPSGTYTFSEAGTYTITVAAHDDSQPPQLTRTQTFQVSVLGGNRTHRGIGMGGCAAASMGDDGPWAALLLAAAAGWLGRRVRSESW
jgi:hypothetical protein